MSKSREQFIDQGRVESEKYEPSEEVRVEFDEAAHLGSAGHQQSIEDPRERDSTSPELSRGDIDAAWEDADSGEENVRGGKPPADQNIVEEVGQVAGLTYQDNEPLHTTEKLEARDKHRWELDPASSEGYNERMEREGEYEGK